jgi:hypothetical protein
MRFPCLTPVLLVAVAGIASLAGCGKNSNSTAPSTDTVRPAPVTTLAVVATTDSSVTLHWTAVGDDSLTGTAALYDLRFFARPITPQNWDSTLYASGVHAPHPAGTAESYTIAPLLPETFYYFAIRVADEKENWSAISNEITATTGVRFYPQNSPASCLRNLRAAYINRNPQAYAPLFAEDFTFVFSPADVSRPIDPTPPNWGLVEELDAATHMLSSELVPRVNLSFTQGAAIPSDNLYPGTWSVQLTQIRLDVYTFAGDGSPLIREVFDGTGKFYFKEFLDQQASDGRPLWKIWRWEDEVSSGAVGQPGFASTEATSWGRIKFSYR